MSSVQASALYLIDSKTSQCVLSLQSGLVSNWMLGLLAPYPAAVRALICRRYAVLGFKPFRVTLQPRARRIVQLVSCSSWTTRSTQKENDGDRVEHVRHTVPYFSAGWNYQEANMIIIITFMYSTTWHASVACAFVNIVPFINKIPNSWQIPPNLMNYVFSVL